MSYTGELQKSNGIECLVAPVLSSGAELPTCMHISLVISPNTSTSAPSSNLIPHPPTVKQAQSSRSILRKEKTDQG
ncbi:hypothetical protein GX48_00036 [Paracoccidioides brasiliensis]|nr:hypothetical protein GX48_00036 [Paracoccidioides brasiliensis]